MNEITVGKKEPRLWKLLAVLELVGLIGILYGLFFVWSVPEKPTSHYLVLQVDQNLLDNFNKDEGIYLTIRPNQFTEEYQ